MQAELVPPEINLPGGYAIWLRPPVLKLGLNLSPTVDRAVSAVAHVVPATSKRTVLKIAVREVDLRDLCLIVLVVLVSAQRQMLS
jgi:hypothetical protein